jgi:aerobic carbon-monoxide dehydrogenase medium subunit
MYPVPIREYHRPTSIDEARELAAESAGTSFFIAGGMSLMQGIKSRIIAPDCLIDLNAIDELRGVVVDGDTIRIGAMTRYREVAESAPRLRPFEALSDAASRVGDRQVRNRGTIGGSLSWNYISACTPVAALACGADMEVLRKNGSRESIPIDDFLLGPMTTALEDGDLLLAVVLRKPGGACGSAYRKWGIVTDSLPVISVGVFLQLDDTGKCTAARFAVGGLDSGPQRSPAAEQRLLAGVDVANDEALRECALVAAAELTTSSDPWIAAEFKTQLIGQLGTEMLSKAAERARA